MTRFPCDPLDLQMPTWLDRWLDRWSPWRLRDELRFINHHIDRSVMSYKQCIIALTEELDAKDGVILALEQEIAALKAKKRAKKATT